MTSRPFVTRVEASWSGVFDMVCSTGRRYATAARVIRKNTRRCAVRRRCDGARASGRSAVRPQAGDGEPVGVVRSAHGGGMRDVGATGRKTLTTERATADALRVHIDGRIRID